MASRRPPLFELLQQDDDPRPGRGSGGVLGSKPQNGHAEGAVERKPTSPPKASTVESLKAAQMTPVPVPAPQAERAMPVHTRAELRAEAKPKSEPRPKTEPKPVAPPKVEAERPAGAADWSGMHPKRAVRVPLLWVYVGVGVFVLAVSGVWGLAYKLGKTDEKNRLTPWLSEGSQEPVGIADPLALGGTPEGERTPLKPIVEREPVARDARPDPVEPEVVPNKPAPTPPAPRIDVLVDIRQAGNNYLKLASGMTLERAKGLAEHLTASGVPAMALNEGRPGFGLYTAFPVPSGQFRTMGEQRREHEARVIRLLGEAPAEAGGPYTPRDQLWMRFDG